jgi:CRISPR-associated protein Cas2
MRRRYLVAYDIRDSVRLRKVHSVVTGYGYPLQYSVFVCDLNKSEKISLMSDLRKVTDQRRDSVVFIDLGLPNERGTECFEFLGTRRRLPIDGEPQIV